MLDVPVEQILTGAVIPANAEYNRLFGEIAGNRSPVTMEIMLEICRQVSLVEQSRRDSGRSS